IASDLDNTRSNFRYYEVANKNAYSSASSKFPLQDQKLIERIRTRREPFLKSQSSQNPVKANSTPETGASVERPQQGSAQLEDVDVLVGPKLSAGFDIGINSSEGRQNWLQTNNDEGCLKMAYPSEQSWGAVFITVGKPRTPPRPSRDFSGYETLSIEMK